MRIGFNDLTSSLRDWIELSDQRVELTASDILLATDSIEGSTIKTPLVSDNFSELEVNSPLIPLVSVVTITHPLAKASARTKEKPS